jgi:hypothetical protein
MERALDEAYKGDLQLPLDVIKRLAVNDSGFVFDPVSGKSFSTNETGKAILKLACVERDPRRMSSWHFANAKFLSSSPCCGDWGTEHG